ncbi:MAG: hypothetical protein HY814_11225 [Candidatus Riflebacteria bacterium]|nr:hypothetical protein [Candidatus Riflebacteria bacterium]
MRALSRKAQGMVEYALIVSLIVCIILGTAAAIGMAVKGNLQTTAKATR